MGRHVELSYTYWLGTGTVTTAYTAYVPCSLDHWAPSVRSDVMDLVRIAEDRIAETNSIAASASPTLRLLLARAEGLATSGVENIRTTMRSLSLLESLRGRSSPDSDLNNRLTLGSVKMNTEAVTLADHRDAGVTVNDINRLHRALFTDTEAQYDAGRLRTEQVWIGGSTRTPAGAHFVPPPHTEVPALMDDLVRYMTDRTIWMPSVAKAAVVHGQFETIHPFFDGNGRVGRAMTNLVLRREGHLRLPVPVSAATEARREAYYDCLRENQTYIGTRQDDGCSAAMMPLVEFTADSVSVACDYAATVAKCVDDWETKCAQVPSRMRAAAEAVLMVVSRSPAATLPFLVEQSGLRRATGWRTVSRLVDLGVITERRDPESGKRFVEADDLIGVVDNRDRLLDEAWRMYHGGQAGIPERLHEEASRLLGRVHASDPSTDYDRSVSAARRSATESRPRPGAASRCGHIGERSRKPCQRRNGHQGRHSY